MAQRARLHPVENGCSSAVLRSRLKRLPEAARDPSGDPGHLPPSVALTDGDSGASSLSGQHFRPFGRLRELLALMRAHMCHELVHCTVVAQRDFD
jgi:hypothetical protein